MSASSVNYHCFIQSMLKVNYPFPVGTDCEGMEVDHMPVCPSLSFIECSRMPSLHRFKKRQNSGPLACAPNLSRNTIYVMSWSQGKEKSADLCLIVRQKRTKCERMYIRKTARTVTQEVSSELSVTSCWKRIVMSRTVK